MASKPNVSESLTRPLRRRRLATVGATVVVVLALMLLFVSPALAFPDVPDSHPYHEAIEGMAAQGVIGGYVNGNFGPEDPVIRQQFAKMMVKTLGLPVTGSEPNPFVDVVAGTGLDPFYPVSYVAVCAARNITKGVDATHFSPYANITRQQVATMVVRAADNLYPGTLAAVPAGWSGVLSYADPTHGANIQKAEHNGLLDGIRASLAAPGLAGWNTGTNATRGEVAQILWNVLLQRGGSGHFEDMGGEFTSGPGVSEHLPEGSGWLIVCARGADDALWETERESGEGYSYPWIRIGEVLTSDPAMAARGTVWSGVFWRGTDNAIWYKGWDGSKWMVHLSLGGEFTSGPAVAMMSTGRVDVFARGTDNALWHISGTGANAYRANWTWSSWENLGGVLTSDPAAVSWGPDRIDVFARGAKNTLVHMWWNGTVWSEWEDLGGILSSGPGAASSDAGRLDIFVRGRGDSLWHKWYDGRWSSWKNLGGVITSDPDAVSFAPNYIDVFARGAGNALLHTWWDGTAWRP